jgi:hypothetical protein
MLDSAIHALHFQAPDAERLEEEMGRFLAWFGKPSDIDPVPLGPQCHRNRGRRRGSQASANDPSPWLARMKTLACGWTPTSLSTFEVRNNDPL